MKSWRQKFQALVWLAIAGGTSLQAQTTNVWLPLPMLSQGERDAGIYPGGEGCQQAQMIAIDAKSGSFILYGTDVGGMYRSVDGGGRFQPCNVGIETCGVVGLAIDPQNPKRCLEVGDGGGNQYNIFGGVNLSTNQGASWTRTCSKWLDALDNGWWSGHGREQVAYAPNSYNATLEYCTTAYWVEECNPQESMGELYKSTDGGSTWSSVAAASAYGGDDNAHSIVKVHPTQGYIYIANQLGHSGSNPSGFYRSINGGSSFTRVLTGNFMSLDVVPSFPEVVWTASGNMIYVSTNAGATFSSFTASGIGSILNLKVSPADTNYLLALDMNQSNRRMYSNDGGYTWNTCGTDWSLSWFPGSIVYDAHNMFHVWDPNNSNTAWCIGDFVSATTNAGVTIKWHNNGNNGIMLGGGFNFNVVNPDILYFGSQDYNGALTTNGGLTWTFINLSVSSPNDGDPWGWVYGAYAADPNWLFGGNQAYGSTTKNLWITGNQGLTSSQKVTGLSGVATACGDPASTNTYFCWNYRSATHGVTWTPMTNCLGVLTCDAANSNLYGAYNNAVVKSLDHGVTWTTVATLSANVSDVAVNPLSKRLWVAAGSTLYRCDPPGYTPVSLSQPNGSATSVAIDALDPNTIYIAGTPGTWRKNDSTVVRSLDNGITWEKLNNRTDLGYDGANCASWCRVHPRTHELWVGTCCFGMWRFGNRVAISANPTSLIIKEGQNATFTVSATGSEPIFYQWKLFGTNIPGANASTYVCSNIVPANAGTYSVIVSNIASIATSSPATLTVVPSPPILSSIAPLGGGSYELTVTGLSAGVYGIDASTNLLDWVNLTNEELITPTLQFIHHVGPAPWFYYRAWRQ